MDADQRPEGSAFRRVLGALSIANLATNATANAATAQCSSHDDTSPSLSITKRDDRVLIKCHAGCTAEAVVAARNLTMADLFDEGTPAIGVPSAQVTEHIYEDEDGIPLYRVLRYAPKAFRQHRWNGSGWDSTLGDARRVPYRLPGLDPLWWTAR